jgi:GAF domain-containing protein
VLVPDVEQFPGHIACSAASRSEIVVPLMRQGEAIGVLDVDSEYLNHFNETDQAFLEEICSVLVAGSDF